MDRTPEGPNPTLKSRANFRVKSGYSGPRPHKLCRFPRTEAVLTFKTFKDLQTRDLTRIVILVCDSNSSREIQPKYLNSDSNLPLAKRKGESSAKADLRESIQEAFLF